MKILTTPNMERCIGCQSCALACARLVYKQLSWKTAGIRIHSTGGLSSSFIAERCLACLSAPCAAVCPTGALTRRKGGGVIFKKKLCIHCGECVPACPIGGIIQDPEQNIYVCIHCGQCVDFCPHNCLEMQEVSLESQEVTS